MHAHKLDPQDDFILMGCDGLFDVMSNEDVVNTVFTSVRDFLRPSLSLEDTQPRRKPTLEETLDVAVQAMMRRCLARRSEDNITVILIVFPAFADFINKTISN